MPGGIDLKARPVVSYGTSDGSSEPVDSAGETITFAASTDEQVQRASRQRGKGKYRGSREKRGKGTPSGDSGALSPLGLAVGGAVAGGFLAAFTGYSPVLGSAAGAVAGGGYGYLRDGSFGLGGDDE